MKTERIPDRDNDGPREALGDEIGCNRRTVSGMTM